MSNYLYLDVIVRSNGAELLRNSGSLSIELNDAFELPTELSDRALGGPLLKFLEGLLATIKEEGNE